MHSVSFPIYPKVGQCITIALSLMPPDDFLQHTKGDLVGFKKVKEWTQFYVVLTYQEQINKNSLR